MKLVIIAGGKGTRLGFNDKPKPMVLVCDKPILEYQIELAKRYGFSEIYILLGYLPQIVMEYFGNGEKFGVNINYIVEENPLGTAGAIKQLEGIVDERFMVFYGDTIMDIDLEKMIEFDSCCDDNLGTILIHPNDHPHDSDLIEINDLNEVVAFHSKPHPQNRYFKNLVNASLYVFSNEIFKYIKSGENCDFGKDIFPMLIQQCKKIKGYHSAEYIKDMGTIERLREVTSDVQSGKIARLNKKYKRKAIFLDRDGVINAEGEIITTPEKLRLLDGVAEAIRKINKSEFLTIIITNQPLVAKGFCSFEALDNIHNKMEHLLGNDGAYIDKIYYCPHHPEKGFGGEVSELKIDCDCRKPKIAMIEKAVEDFNIDIDNSYFIGDTTVDIQTAKNAGIKSILLETGYGGLDGKFDIKPDYKFEILNDAIKFILEKNYDNK